MSFLFLDGLLYVLEDLILRDLALKQTILVFNSSTLASKNFSLRAFVNIRSTVSHTYVDAYHGLKNEYLAQFVQFFP